MMASRFDTTAAMLTVMGAPHLNLELNDRERNVRLSTPIRSTNVNVDGEFDSETADRLDAGVKFLREQVIFDLGLNESHIRPAEAAERARCIRIVKDVLANAYGRVDYPIGQEILKTLAGL